MKLGTNQVCPIWSEITTENRCKEADKWTKSLELHPKRAVLPGSWPDVPFQCSAQVGFDDTIHFSTNSQTNNRRFETGEFVMLCEKGL